MLRTAALVILTNGEVERTFKVQVMSDEEIDLANVELERTGARERWRYLQPSFFETEHRHLRTTWIGIQSFRLCRYHAEKLGWEGCSDEAEGCEVELARAAVRRIERIRRGIQRLASSTMSNAFGDPGT